MSQPENEAKEGKGMSKKPVVNIIVDAVPRGKLKAVITINGMTESRSSL